MDSGKHGDSGEIPVGAAESGIPKASGIPNPKASGKRVPVVSDVPVGPGAGVLATYAFTHVNTAIFEDREPPTQVSLQVAALHCNCKWAGTAQHARTVHALGMPCHGRQEDPFRVFDLLDPASGTLNAFRSLQRGADPTEVLTWAAFGWEPLTMSFMGGRPDSFFKYEDSVIQARASQLSQHMQAHRGPSRPCPLFPSSP
jgi:hypothetical protein